jgi:bifunctional non-homologous end joining protein LigD
MSATSAGAGLPDAVPPMLAVAGELPVGGGYALEWKWDGYRGCCRIGADGTVRISSRNGIDLTTRFPELIDPLADRPHGQAAVLDGEIVALDTDGRPEFDLLQERAQQNTPSPGLVGRVPVTYMVFDLLVLGERSLVGQPYTRRREQLAGLDLTVDGRVLVPDWFASAEISGAQMLRVADEQGLEGVVAKKLDSPYLPGRRSDYWIKHALVHTLEVVVGGWRPGSGRRAGTIGSLLLGAHDPRTGELRYIGDVGTGFTDQALAHLAELLQPLERPTSPFANPVPRNAHWVEPVLLGEVVYRRFTRDGKVRHTSWRGLRIDKSPEDAVLPK